MLAGLGGHWEPCAGPACALSQPGRSSARRATFGIGSVKSNSHRPPRGSMRLADPVSVKDAEGEHAEAVRPDENQLRWQSVGSTVKAFLRIDLGGA